MRLRICLVYALLGLASNAWGQMKLKFVQSFAAQSNQHRVDPLGYSVYFEKDAVYKMDTTGNLLYQQSLKIYGQITDIDVINPMKYLVFFREQQSINFFDNTFTPYQSSTRLSDLGVSYATLVCYSMQFERFWVFDQDNSKLILFNSDGKRGLETENLNGLIGLTDPCQMLERNGNLYIVDDNRGVYIFDMFGSLVDFIEVAGIKWIQVDANNFFYVNNNQIMGYNFSTKAKFSTPVATGFGSWFQLVKSKFYLLADKTVHVYGME